MKFDLEEIVKIIHLPRGGQIPEVADIGLCSIFVCDPHDDAWDDEGNGWRFNISNWIIESNCRYMVAWGPQSTKWDDGVDESYLVKNNYVCHDENMCMTTWHDNVTIESAFEFFINCANVESNIQKKIIVDISDSQIDFYGLEVPE